MGVLFPLFGLALNLYEDIYGLVLNVRSTQCYPYQPLLIIYIASYDHLRWDVGGGGVQIQL